MERRCRAERRRPGQKRAGSSGFVPRLGKLPVPGTVCSQPGYGFFPKPGSSRSRLGNDLFPRREATVPRAGPFRSRSGKRAGSARVPGGRCNASPGTGGCEWAVATEETMPPVFLSFPRRPESRGTREMRDVVARNCRRFARAFAATLDPRCTGMTVYKRDDRRHVPGGSAEKRAMARPLERAATNPFGLFPPGRPKPPIPNPPIEARGISTFRSGLPGGRDRAAPCSSSRS